MYTNFLQIQFELNIFQFYLCHHSNIVLLQLYYDFNIIILKLLIKVSFCIDFLYQIQFILLNHDSI